MSDFTHTQQKVVDAIVDHPGIKGADLAQALGMTENVLKVHIHNIRKRSPKGMRLATVGEKFVPGHKGALRQGYAVLWDDEPVSDSELAEGQWGSKGPAFGHDDYSEESMP